MGPVAGRASSCTSTCSRACSGAASWRCWPRPTTQGRLKFFGNHAALADRRAFKRFLAPLRKIEWVVHTKDPFAGPEQVLRYLSRYTHRVAISNRRLVSADDTASPSAGRTIASTDPTAGRR